jgi:hypothetical protein
MPHIDAHGTPLEEITMPRTPVILLALAAILSSPPALCEDHDPYDKAIETYGCGDYVKAFNLFMPLAMQGLAVAEYQIGMMTEQGQGTMQDMLKAYEWYTKAAEKGVADAYYALGQLYSKGEVVTRDPPQAHALFELATKGGNKVARDWLKMEAARLDDAGLAKSREYAQQWLARAKN